MLRVIPISVGLALICAVLSTPFLLQAASPSSSCIQLIQNSTQEDTFHPSDKTLSDTYRPLQRTEVSGKNGQLNGQVGRKTTEETGDFETPTLTALRHSDPPSSSHLSTSLSSATAGEVTSSPFQPSISLIEPPGQAILRELSGSSPSQILELLTKLYRVDYSFSEQTKLIAKFTDEIVKKLGEFNKSQLMEIVFWLDLLDIGFNEKFIREWRKSAKAIRRQFSSLDRYWLYSIFRKWGVSPEEAQVRVTY